VFPTVITVNELRIFFLSGHSYLQTFFFESFVLGPSLILTEMKNILLQNQNFPLVHLEVLSCTDTYRVQCWLLILKGEGFPKPSLRGENKLDGTEFQPATDTSEGYKSVNFSLIASFGRTVQLRAHINSFLLLLTKTNNMAPLESIVQYFPA
jgi:hypothetical protein